jgi:hypothetical protein
MKGESLINVSELKTQAQEMTVTFLVDSIKFSDALVTQSIKKVRPFDCNRTSLKKLANLFESIQKGTDKED